MNHKTSHLIVAFSLLTLLVAVGCPEQSPDSPLTESDSEKPSVAGKQKSSEDDKRCEEILKSPNIMEARDWLKRYPKGLFSSHALDPDDPNGTPLAPVVARLVDAGAKPIVIHYGMLGKGQVLLGVVVGLPADPDARQKIFAMEPELSQLCQQRSTKDYGQKYLYYSME
jgi:hypothetical protein